MSDLNNNAAAIPQTRAADCIKTSLERKVPLDDVMLARPAMPESDRSRGMNSRRWSQLLS